MSVTKKKVAVIIDYILRNVYFEWHFELIDKNKSNVVKVSLNKVTFLSFIFFSLILIFGITIIYLSLSC